MTKNFVPNAARQFGEGFARIGGLVSDIMKSSARGAEAGCGVVPQAVATLAGPIAVSTAMLHAGPAARILSRPLFGYLGLPLPGGFAFAAGMIAAGAAVQYAPEIAGAASKVTARVMDGSYYNSATITTGDVSDQTTNFLQAPQSHQGYVNIDYQSLAQQLEEGVYGWAEQFVRVSQIVPKTQELSL